MRKELKIFISNQQIFPHINSSPTETQMRVESFLFSLRKSPTLNSLVKFLQKSNTEINPLPIFFR